MTDPRVAVLVRTYFWDDFAARSAHRIWKQSDGLDFYVLADETQSGPLDVGSFSKLGHDIAYFERRGLPCVAPGQAAKLWWNCDYGLYDAVLRLPDYDYYLLIEADVAVNTPLLPLVEQVIAAGLDGVTCDEQKPIVPGWTFAASCADLPYAVKTWVPLSVMLVSRPAALHLLSERQRLGRLYAEAKLSEWPICEGFVSSALANGGYVTAPLRQFADVTHFSTEALFLESDPRTRRPGSFCHSVLDAERFWKKFAGRAFWRLLESGSYGELRRLREALVNEGRTQHEGWRIVADPRNLALDRPARQSSVSEWSRKPRFAHADANAIDARGANCGVLTGRHGFHTAREDRPWWSVDLQRPCMVEEVRIYNGHFVPERARRLAVEVSDDGAAWREVHRKSDDRVFTGNDDPLVCRLPRPMPASHLRIVLEGSQLLHLSEVQVFGAALPRRRGSDHV